MKHLILTTIALSLLVTNPAIAGEADNRAMQMKIDRLERVVDSLIKEQESQPSLSLKPGIRLKDPDNRYSFGLDGFVQGDAGWMDAGTNDLPDGTTIKRARLGVKGTIETDWKYRILTDFGNDDFQLMDANLSYTGFDNLNLTVGQFKEPFSLEQLMAAKYWTFTEKASMAALTPKRSLGVGATYDYGDGIISAGLFGENVNKNRADDEGYGVTGRMTYVPVHDKNKLVHIGLSGAYREPDAETGSVRFKNAGHNTLTGAFVDTGKINNVSSVTSFNPEIVLVYDAFSLQGEYTHTRVERDVGSDLDFVGYYGEASYFLTGESRKYNRKKGVFGKVKPEASFNWKNNEWGAWQLAYRYSHIDLNDHDITGGEMNSHTFGVNWFPNIYTRLSANVIYNQTDHEAKIPDAEATIFMLRTQFEL